MAAKTVIAGTGAGAALMALVLSISTPSLQREEGTKYIAYQDQVKVLTVCTGHTGPDVVVGKVYTPAECETLTSKDSEIAAKGVLKVSPQLIYHPIVLAAAVSFSYNVGVGTYAQSSVARDFNAGNLVLGCNDMLKYVYAGGLVNQGLINRRNQEHALCVASLTPQGVKNANLPR